MATVQPQTLSTSLLGDRYEVLAPLGAGASANVFRVRDLRTGAVRAAKVLKTGNDRIGSSFSNASRAETLSRFEDEFRILRTLHHPHLPEVFDYGRTEDGVCFLTMELVDGEPLDAYFREHPSDIWVILYELCETLVFVHARNLLHQDIKPSNILVSRAAVADGERPVIKLIDFGLTYRRGVGAAVRLVGTAEYIAPEVARGERSLTRAVDYYSLGATLFELLTGAPPFVGSENDVLRAHLEREPVIENEELEWAELYPHVRGLLAKDPQKRLAAFEEFRRVVVGRLTGGIDDLDRSYALARIDSLGMIGKKAPWDSLLKWFDAVATTAPTPEAHTLSVAGVEGVGKRFLTSSLRAEASLRGVRTLAPYEIGWTERDDAAARQPAMMWSRLLEACEKEPVILVVDRPMSLPDEERSFVRLAGTQWELYRSRGRVLPLFFLMAVDSTSEDAETLDYLPSDAAIKLELPALSRTDCEHIVDQFRGAMFDPRDARALTTYLERFDNAGAAIQALQRAVLRGGLTFLGQRWKVQPGLLTEIVESHRDDSFARELVASLWPFERRVAALVAAHPDPVPVAWVAAFADVDTSAVLSIVTGPAKRLLTASADHVAPASGAVRAALRAGCDPAQMQQAHEFLAEKLVHLERSISVDRTLAHHLEQLGRVRDAARVHLRLLHAYWSIRPRERPYELIESVCRSGLELLEAHGSTVTASTRRHLFCFYLKQWINAFWVRNLFTRAKPVIDEWTKRLSESMPASVAPRYARSLLDARGPAVALEWVRQFYSAFPTTMTQLNARFQLEQSLCLHYSGQYEQALAALPVTKSREALCPRDLYRLEIYRAMHLSELGQDQESRAIVSRTVREAERDGFIDESLLMHAIIARSLLMEGNTKASLAASARGLRLALGAGLYYRANLMYRMSSTAYEELGDARRSWRCLEKAIQIADSLGLRELSGASWHRLGSTERKAGRYGNALQNLDRAVALIGENGAAWSRMQALVGLYGVMVLVQSKRRLRLEEVLAKYLQESREDNALGYFSCWRGWDREHQGQLDMALEDYHRGAEYFRVAGTRSNVAWALSHEARVRLALGDLERASALLDRIEVETNTSGSREAAFELAVLRLKKDFLSRSPWKKTASSLAICEAGLKQWQTASSKVEALQILFRVYGRQGMIEEANRTLIRYRELILEMSSNLQSFDATQAIELSHAGEIVEEIAILDRRAKS